MSELDPWDPNNWGKTEHEFRIYGDDRASVWAVVDEEDYHRLIRYRWCAKIDKGGKVYLRRAVGENADGMRLRTSTVYLHVDVLTAAEGPPPTRMRCIADHLNGDSLYCRRLNLRWATKRENNQNRFGSAYRQQQMRI